MNFVDYLFMHSKNSNEYAVAGNSESISHKDLYHLVNRIAYWLHDSVGQNKKIILISDNSIFFIASYLGIIKSGNVCVPLNPSTSADSLRHIVGKCNAKIGFIQKKSIEKFAGTLIHIFDESILDILHASPELQSRQDFDSNRLAEILFTSGSTALPKGVMLSHRNLMANTASIIQYLELNSKDRVEVVLPFYYCYGLSLLHTHIKVGGSIVLNNTFIMLNTVIDDMLRYECTGFAGVPSHFQILLRKSRRFKRTKFPHLRYVTQAGGKLPNIFIREFVESFPKVKFFVMYGQTEATARLSYLPPELVLKKLGSIGKGIPGVKLEVVDECDSPIRPGEIGEIVASGENVMMGYFKESELTRQTIKNGKLYTGDIATIDEDGYIYILAREKEFLKVGGERISPKEIEEVIVRLPEIVDCSIISVQDEILGEAIKAFVVLKDGVTLTEDDIRKHCNRYLSSNKIPKFIEFLDEIPVAETGKKIKEELLHLGVSAADEISVKNARNKDQ